jgi:hypothetical protein
MAVKSSKVASLYRPNSPPKWGQDATMALEALHDTMPWLVASLYESPIDDDFSLVTGNQPTVSDDQSVESDG